jgi:hypothetical protein
MESTIDSKCILGWERLPLFGRYDYVEMIKCSTTKTLSICRLCTGYQYSPFMVISKEGGGSSPIFEVCARLEATARDTFSQHGWPHSLRIGSLTLGDTTIAQHDM